MRAVLCTAFEGIKSLSVGETSEPRPAPDEVLIDVHAASVSYMDYLMICGGYQMRPQLPYVPGTDAAGVVVAIWSIAFVRAIALPAKDGTEVLRSE